MAELLLMPALSPTMTQGFLIRWHKNIGDVLKPGDLLMDVETDKAMMEVETTQGGIIEDLLTFQEAVLVGQVIGVLRQKNEEEGVGKKLLQETLEKTGQKSEEKKLESKEKMSQKEGKVENPQEKNKKQEDSQQCKISGSFAASQDNLLSPLTPKKTKRPLLWSFSLESSSECSQKTAEEENIDRPKGHLKVSPYGKKWAKDHNINLQELPSHLQKEPRLKQKDIENYYYEYDKQQRGEKKDGESLGSSPSKRHTHHTFGEGPSFFHRPLSPMQRVIAQRLSESKATIPHFYLSLFCPMDAVVALRQRLNTEQKYRKFSLTDFIVKACGLSIRDNPFFRQTWVQEESYTVRDNNDVDISLAVSLEEGLITPVLRSVDTMTFGEVYDVSRDLTQRAREGKLRKEEFTGGVFTISNLGMMNVDHFLPIINPPQSGILAVGSLRSQVTAEEDGSFKVVQGITFTLAADHRMINGDVGARFLTSLQYYLSHPHSLLVL